MTEATDITALLLAWSEGDESARSRLVEAVYGELRRVARRQLRQERPDHSFTPTALVHEAYLKLIDQRRVRWQNRAHFFALAAQLMRRILVDFARSRGQHKRGGDLHKTSFDEALVISKAPDPDLVSLDEALSSLAAIDPRKAQVVELRFFGGLDEKEIGHVLNISVDTVQRDWKTARVWLNNQLRTG